MRGHRYKCFVIKIKYISIQCHTPSIMGHCPKPLWCLVLDLCSLNETFLPLLNSSKIAVRLIIVTRSNCKTWYLISKPHFTASSIGVIKNFTERSTYHAIEVSRYIKGWGLNDNDKNRSPSVNVNYTALDLIVQKLAPAFALQNDITSVCRQKWEPWP